MRAPAYLMCPTLGSVTHAILTHSKRSARSMHLLKSFSHVKKGVLIYLSKWSSLDEKILFVFLEFFFKR